MKNNHLGKFIYIILGLWDLTYFASYSLCDTRGLEGSAHCYAGFLSPALEVFSSFVVMAGWFPPGYLLLFAPLVYSLVYPFWKIWSCYRQHKQEQGALSGFGFWIKPGLWYAVLFLCFQLALLFLIPTVIDYGDQKAYEQKLEKVTANQDLINQTSELYKRITTLLHREQWSILQTATNQGSAPQQSRVVTMDGRILRVDNPEGASYIDRFGEYYLVGEGGKNPFQSTEYVPGKIYFFTQNGSMDLNTIIPRALEKGFFIRKLLDDISFTRDLQEERAVLEAWVKENDHSFRLQSEFSSSRSDPGKYLWVSFENEETDHPKIILTTLSGKNIQLEFTIVLDINEALRFPYDATEVK